MVHPRMRVAAIWSISVWPALNYLMLNWPEMVRRGPRALVGVLLITTFLGGCGQIVHHYAARRGRGGMVVLFWFAAVVMLFGYSVVSEGTDRLFEATSVRIPPMIAWIAIITALSTFIIRFRKHVKLQLVATRFCLIVGVMSFMFLLVTAIRFEKPHDESAAVDAAIAPKAARLPGLNVYYILLDAYAGKRGLKDVSHFDNSKFYELMATRGFVDASTEKSNYLQTVTALGGIFALDYPQTENPATWGNTNNLYPEVFENERAPALIARLNAAGYVTWHSATAWGGCAHHHLKCLGNPFALGPDYVTQAFLSPTPFGRPLMYLAGENDNAFYSITSRLPVLLGLGTPFFIFAHHMAPHPPFHTDARCVERGYRLDKWNSWDPVDTPAYVDSVQCVNSQVERLVDIIVRLNPNALIVLQGDHGSAFTMAWERPMRTWTADSLRERGSYLNLIRAPFDCRRWLDRPLGQVNTARFVVGCVEGKAPEYLPERSYMSTYSEGSEKGMVLRRPD